MLVKLIIRDLLEAVALFIVVFIVLHFSVQNFRIDGSSMHPTLADEQHLIVSKAAYSGFNPSALLHSLPFIERTDSKQPHYGDIIAFTHPGRPSLDLVKRVVGLPGDIIEIERGRVIRNGEPLREPYVLNGDTGSVEPVEVPPNSYFVLGDNRSGSTDSRAWGFVSEDHIIGRAWLSYWPSDRIAFLHPLW